VLRQTFPYSIASPQKWGTLATSRIRVLVVDDFEPFRSFLRSALKQKPDLEVIGELSDGLAAVQKAEELRPDLILIDIGLPKLNGIEAVRQIRKLVPYAKIIFLTQESSDDVVQTALNLGASGYVVKAWAGSELLPAVEAVLQGGQFVSGRVTGHDPREVRDRRHPSKDQPLQTAPGSGRAGISRRHEIMFYSAETSLLESFTLFIAAALKAGNVAMVITTESRRADIRKRLQARGVDVAAAVEESRYIALDVAETLFAFMFNGMPDEARFEKVTGDLIHTAAKAVDGDHSRVSACGECAPTLCAERMGEAAIRVEQLWDEVAKKYRIDILCGYSTSGFHNDADRHILQRICAEHSAVRPAI
jgi:DNA-binding NarL/FixJ family response regulator